MATYYCSPTGAGTTCSFASPCSLEYAVDTKAGAGDTVVLLDGTYTIIGTITTNNGIYVDAYNKHLAIIDGLSMTGAFLLLLVGTTLSNVVLQNAGAPTFGGAKYAITGSGTNKIISCKFDNNYQDIYWSAWTGIIERCLSINVYTRFLRDVEDPGANTMTVRYNRLLGARNKRGDDANAVMLTRGVVNIYNNIIGGYANGISLLNNYSATITGKNNVFMGNALLNVVALTAAGGSVTLEKNAYYGSNIHHDFGDSLSGAADSSPIATSNLGINNDGPGYLILRFDDAAHADEQRQICDVLDQYGFKATLAVDAATLGAAEKSIYLDLIANGHSIACHSWSHMSMDNDEGSTHDHLFTVNKQAGGDIDITITSSGSPPNETVTLALTESVSGDNISINLCTGAITGDTTAEDLTTIAGIRNYLHAKSYITCSVMTYVGGGVYYPEKCKSRILKDVAINNLAAETELLVDVDRVTYWEMVYPKAYLETELGVTVDVFVHPFYDGDSSTPDRLLSAGYVCALFEPISQDENRGDLRELGAFTIPTYGGSGLVALTNAQILQVGRSLGAYCLCQRKVVTYITHYIGGLNDLTLEQWIYFLQGIKDSGVSVITGNQFANMLTADWDTADSGLNYTRTIDTDPGCSLNGASACINAGDNTVFTGTASIKDYAGYPITDAAGAITAFMGTVDIGAYEWVGVPGLAPGLGLSGGNRPPAWHRRRR